MNRQSKIVFGLLVLLVGIGFISVTFQNVNIKVEKDKTDFFIYDNGWKKAGTEFNRIFQGNKVVNPDKSRTTINHTISGNKLLINRKTYYGTNGLLEDTYVLRNDVKDIELFPVRHTVKAYNLSGKFYRYTVDNLRNEHKVKRLDGETLIDLGLNMKVNLHPGYRWGWIGRPYGSDSISAQYDIKSDLDTFNVRLFDPPSSSDISIKSPRREWVVTKFTANESREVRLPTYQQVDRNTWVVCFDPVSDLDVSVRQVRDRSGSLVPSVKVGNADCVTVDTRTTDYLRIGDNTIITEYQDVNLVNYQGDWFDLNVTLYINLSNNLNNTVNNVFVFDNPEADKFGAGVLNYNTTQQFKYVAESSEDIEQIRNNKYRISRISSNIIGSLSGTRLETHDIDFSDICYVRRNKTEVVYQLGGGLNDTGIDGTVFFDSQCNFNLIDNRTLEVVFFAEYNSTYDMILIDPEIVINNVDTANSIKNNVTTEAYPLSHAETNDSALILYTPFDLINKSTTVYDYSPYDNDGTITSATFEDSGYISGAYEFDGLNDHIDYGDVLPNPSDGWAIVGWLNWTSAGDNEYTLTIEDNGGGEWVSLLIDLNSNLKIASNGKTPGDDAEIFSLHTWQHIGMVWDGSQFHAYKNGSLQYSVTPSSTTFLSGLDRVVIGHSFEGSSNRYEGVLDEIMLFNRTLNSTEINTIYNDNFKRYKTPATQRFESVNIQQNGSFYGLNVTTNSTQNFSTSMQMRIIELERKLNNGFNATNLSTRGNQTWNSPENATTDNNFKSTSLCTGTSCSINSQYLRVRNFSLDIPTGVEVDNIIAQINWSSLGCQYLGGCKSHVKLALANGSLSNNNASLVHTGTGFAYRDYGGKQTEVWNLNLSASDVNDDDFGIVFATTSSAGPGGSMSVSVEHIRLLVFYNGTYSKWEIVENGNNKEKWFNISSTTNYTSLEFNFTTDTNNFYSPVLRDVINLESWVGSPPDAVEDNLFPTFANFNDNNGTLIDSGTARFNVTLNNTNGTVFLEIDSTNYTAFNTTGNLFNVTVEMSSSGVFGYLWSSYGNGTLNNYNATALRYYTVNGSICNITDAVLSIWGYTGGKYIDGFGQGNVELQPENDSFGQEIWTYSGQLGRYVDGISTGEQYTGAEVVDNCNTTDIAIGMWSYSDRFITGVATTDSSGITINSPEIGEAVWGWLDRLKMPHGTSS